MLENVSPGLAAWLADAILLLHIAVVMFVVLGLVVVLLGGWREWHWVRNRCFRLTHLLLIGFIVAQTWIGQLCPLTIWEQNLRARAGQTAYAESFIEHWLSRLLYVQAPWWVFTLAYTAFGLLVAMAWWRIPPRQRHASSAKQRGVG